MDELERLNLEVERLSKEAHDKSVTAFQAQVFADKAVEKRDEYLLEIFWRTKPGIVIKKGMRLIVTKGYVDFLFSINKTLCIDRGVETWVCDIKIMDGIPQFWVIGDNGIALWASLEHVRAMHEAYLELQSS